MTRRGSWSLVVGILPAMLLSGALSAAEPVRDGFVLEPASIPASEILGGGPPRDGVPALDHPTTLPAAQADWSNDVLVLGIVVGGAARA